MQRATSLSQYARAPAGRYLVGSGWLAFCHTPTLWGFAVWGRASTESMSGLLPALELELQPGVPAHASLVDASRLTSADAASFEALGRYVEHHRAALQRQVQQLAIVHPRGFEGAVVTGFFKVLEPPYPVHLCADVEHALAALNRPDAHLSAALRDRIDEAAGTSPLLGAVRAALTARPSLSIADAARALRLPARTLQRRLGELGTSFSAVSAQVRLERALDRIVRSQDALTTIALDVGYASPQHMGRAVKAATGRTPSQLRARQ